MRWEFDATTFRWEARRELWVFAALPDDVSGALEERPHPPAGWDSIRVTATLGSSRWATSVFPQADGRYVLPLKKAVRDREGVELGDTVRLGIEVD
jgi:hypothetical protein